GRPAEEGGPRAVPALPGADPGRCRGRLAIVEEPEVVTQEQILGVDGHVRLELALPPPLGVLQRQEMPDGTVQDGASVGLRRAVGERRHRATPTASRVPAGTPASAARAAATPLRTALSIVAGQPVSVHEPAR